MHPVLVEFGFFRLHSYGVLIALGGMACVWIWHRRRDRMGIVAESDFWLLVNVILFGGFIGGRILYLLEYTRPFSAEFWRISASFSQGFSVLGAFAGVSAGLWWFCRSRAVPALRIFDGVTLCAPLWHSFGRVGCFLAGCCFGRPSDLPWAVTFRDPRSMVERSLLGMPLHPAQLYEVFLDLALFAILWSTMRKVDSGRLPRGAVTAYYFAGYGLVRFFTEFYRGDVVRLGAGLTVAQVIAAAFILGAAAGYSRLAGGRK